ncbi:hypothetical protein MXC99_06345 [Thauera aromatica]|uniref:hypothetical protein n=1 Tax=Thauera aromatica TaxID=59405 RepID=UPI001FFC7869|nr:hypothetical protein [Thauera aromatica]MCK2087793.1 hypothetical protein [Thauera aromatica]
MLAEHAGTVMDLYPCDVDALVPDSELPHALLGMSFLDRVQWQHDGHALRFAR